MLPGQRQYPLVQIGKPGAEARQITGNWPRYLAGMRGAKSGRESISREQLLDLLKKQNYRCALTGQEMTCIRGQGRLGTNASLDRINAGKPYTIENVQLVCDAVNSWRGKFPLLDFVAWCRLVVAHADTIQTDRDASGLISGAFQELASMALKPLPESAEEMSLQGDY